MAIQGQDLTYRDGDRECLGYLAFDSSNTGPRPGVLVVHEAWGLGRHAMDATRKLAGLGYTTFAADLYGQRRQVSLDEVRPVMAEFMDDPAVLRRRTGTALETLASQPTVDTSQLFAIGFCFGGTAVLELARNGSDLLGVVAFHGKLTTQAPAPSGGITASILTLIGADDPVVPPEERSTFEQEMQQAGADWQLHVYGKVQHSFTNPAADGSMPGALYDVSANRRAWLAMLNFFEERLKTS